MSTHKRIETEDGYVALFTPAEFVSAIDSVVAEHAGDHEVIHSKTDDLMELLLQSLGYGEGIAKLQKSTRWYA